MPQCLVAPPEAEVVEEAPHPPDAQPLYLVAPPPPRLSSRQPPPQNAWQVADGTTRLRNLQDIPGPQGWHDPRDHMPPNEMDHVTLVSHTFQALKRAPENLRNAAWEEYVEHKTDL
eukprot:3066776-Heterocapsa_arctica.AAC.1